MASRGIDPRTGNIVIRAYAGVDPLTHKPHTISVTLPSQATESEIAVAEAELEARAAVTKKSPEGMTIGSAVKFYVDMLPELKKSPTTIMAYRSYAQRHVIPRIGSIMFMAADASVFAEFLRDLGKSKSAGGAGLSASTIEKICAFLKGCFRKLKSDGIVPVNPMVEVRVPHVRTQEQDPLELEDYRKIVEYLDKTLAMTVRNDADFERYVFAVIVWVDLHTGLRRGELSGLQDRHHVYTAGEPGLRILRVLKEANRQGRPGLSDGSPKSDASKATVSLDATTDEIICEYFLIRDEILAEHGIEPSLGSPLFCHADGSPWRPRHITDTFAKLREELDLEPGVHLHILRHTHVSVLIDEGASMKDIQARARHSSMSVTADIYGHLMPGRTRELAEMSANRTRDVARSISEKKKAAYVPNCPKDGQPCARFAMDSEVI